MKWKIASLIAIYFGCFSASFAAELSHSIEKTWDGGYCADLQVKNTSQQEIHNWEIRFDFPGEITSFWNAQLSQNNTHYTFTGKDWNNPLDPDQDFTIGYCAESELTIKNFDFVSGEKKENKNTFLEPLEIGNPLDSIATIGEYSPPFFAKNGKLYDSENTLVQLRGVNWFGFAGDSRIAGGLWKRNYKDIASQIKQTGFNSVRLPFCPGTIREQISQSYSRSNPELVGKNSLELMDIFITHLAGEGIYILLDMHTSDCKNITDTPFIPGYDYQMWENDWKFVVNRYKNIKNVIAVDPKNEPHGDAVWNDQSNNFDINRKLQVEKIGSEILKINPDLLIFVNGIEKNHKRGSDIMDCEIDLSQSWGGNINPIDCYPINEDKIPAEKMILSPHIYGPSVYPRDYFSDENFPENMDEIWEKTFGKYADKYTLIFGEFGGNYLAQDKLWQDALIDYMIEKRIDSFYYWSWNPNSTDTKGLVLDDWKTLEIPKYNNLSRLFFQNRNLETQAIKSENNFQENTVETGNITELSEEVSKEPEAQLEAENGEENIKNDITIEEKINISSGENNEKISDYFANKNNKINTQNQEKTDTSEIISIENNDEKLLITTQQEEKKWWEKILEFFKKLFENIKLFFST